jgi:hypothetical protein
VTKFCKRTNLYFDHCTIEKNGHVCGSKFVHHGATTRLNKHLIQKHNIKLAVVNKSNDNNGNSSNTNTNNNNNQNNENDNEPPKILNSIMHNQQQVMPSSRSNNSNSFENIGQAIMANRHIPPSLHNSHFDLSHFSAKSNLNQASNNNNLNGGLLLSNGGSNSNSSKNANFSDSNMLLVSFILSSSTSIDLLENKWFRMFIENLNSSYKLPTKDELNSMFKNLYKEKKAPE